MLDLKKLSDSQIKNLIQALLSYLNFYYDYDNKTIASLFEISNSYFSRIRNSLKSPRKETKIEFVNKVLKRFDLKVSFDKQEYQFQRAFKRKITEEFSFYCFFIGDPVRKKHVLQLRIELRSKYASSKAHLLTLDNKLKMSGIHSYGSKDFSSIKFGKEKEENPLRLLVRNDDKKDYSIFRNSNPFFQDFVVGIYQDDGEIYGQFVAVKKQRGYTDLIKGVLWRIEINGFPENFEPIRAKNLHQFIQELDKPNNYSKTIVLELQKELFTAYQQFLNFFQYYVKKVKGKTIQFNTIRKEGKLEIKVSPVYDESHRIITNYLNEYLNLLFQNTESLVINYETNPTIQEKEIVIKELQHQINNLNGNLNLARSKNQSLKSNVDLLKDLIILLGKSSDNLSSVKSINIGDTYISEFINEGNMKINNQNIFGGNQQFADLIINQSSILDETDTRFIKLINENTDSIEEKKALITNLEKIKSDEISKEEKNISGGILKKFLDSIVSESGKQLIKEIVEHGGEIVQYLR